jgi:hypothetical protein
VRSPEPRSSGANVAALLTWVLPGAGHVFLGRVAFGVACFALVEGLYWAGLTLSDGRAFEFLDPELRSGLATLLAPEAGNLGGWLYQMRHYGFGLGTPSAWPEHMRVGTMLCSLSGVLNACLMAQAHLDARRADVRRAGAAPAGTARRLPAGLCAAAAWLLPGLGHWLQGRRLRAAVVCALLVGLLALGTWLAEGSNLSRERHFYFWGGQFLGGLPAVALELGRSWRGVAREIRYVDVGLLFASVAGLLNILAMMDVYAWREAEDLGLPYMGEESAADHAGPAAEAGEMPGAPGAPGSSGSAA